MASKVQIINRALIALGFTTTITDIDEDSVAAQLAKAIWDTCVEHTLASHPWSCAQQRWEIAADADAPIWGFAYQYTKPADCVAVFEMQDQESYDWKVERSKIVTDHGSPIFVSGNGKVTNPGEFDAAMVEALAYKLAMEMAVPLTQSKTLRDQMEANFKDRTVTARTLSSRQRTAQVVEVSAWTGARR